MAAEALIGAPGGGDIDWQPPETPVAGDVAATLRQKLADVRPLLEPAERSLLAKWIATLAILTAGRLSAEDASARVDAYVTLLAGKVLRGALTEASLGLIARKYKFFPSFADLARDLDLGADVYVERKQRIAVLLGLPPHDCGYVGFNLEVRRWKALGRPMPFPDVRAFIPGARDELEVEGTMLARAIGVSSPRLDT